MVEDNQVPGGTLVRECRRGLSTPNPDFAESRAMSGPEARHRPGRCTTVSQLYTACATGKPVPGPRGPQWLKSVHMAPRRRQSWMNQDASVKSATAALGALPAAGSTCWPKRPLNSPTYTSLTYVSESARSSELARASEKRNSRGRLVFVLTSLQDSWAQVFASAAAIRPLVLLNLGGVGGRLYLTQVAGYSRTDRKSGVHDRS